MKRLRYPAGWWSYGLLLLLLGIVVFAAALGALARQPGTPAAETVTSDTADGKRRFYITDFNATGATAEASCTAGYHMASLWEIFDTSALVYAAGVGAATTNADQGTGPPAGWWGWVRTGHDASALNQAGRANCTDWTSDTVGEYGTIVRLANQWTAGSTAISPWQAQTWSCSGVAPVWCVSNAATLFLPVTTR